MKKEKLKRGIIAEEKKKSPSGTIRKAE